MSWSYGAGQLVHHSAGPGVTPVKQSIQMEGWE